MKNLFLKTMFKFCREASEIALRELNHSKPDLKDDNSVITIADKKISELAHQELSEFLKTPDHILIDEEDPRKDGYLDQKFLEKKNYIWSVDPVDGTRLYANQIPLYGISIGLIKDLKPWLGAVYFPGQNELFYCDGDSAFVVLNPFTDDKVTRKIEKIKQTISSRSLFLLSDIFFKHFDWDYSDCRLLVTACATVNLCWPLIGRGCGSMDQSHIWDFAGSWPIVRAAGMEMRNQVTGEILDKVDVSKFQKSPAWKMKEYHILSTEENFPLLKNKILKKQ